MSKKILLVDDEEDIRKLVTGRLKLNGYEVITAIDGEDGLSKARTEVPDLIILDLMLPKIDGYKVCRMLKFDVNFKHIPIILFTAKAEEEDIKTGMEVGADAYLAKPFEPQVLLDKVKGLLQV